MKRYIAIVTLSIAVVVLAVMQIKTPKLVTYHDQKANEVSYIYENGKQVGRIGSPGFTPVYPEGATLIRISEQPPTYLVVDSNNNVAGFWTSPK